MEKLGNNIKELLSENKKKGFERKNIDKNKILKKKRKRTLTPKIRSKRQEEIIKKQKLKEENNSERSLKKFQISSSSFNN